MKKFNLPDVGEGLQEAEIVQWNVAVGDLVEEDQIILVIETDKANVEIPSPFHGKISQIYGKPGDIVKVGSVLVEFDEETDETDSEPEDSGTVVGKLEIGTEVLEETAAGIQTRQLARSGIKAPPVVRALATRLGVDLSSVEPTGPKGSFTRSDVEKAAGKNIDLSVKKQSVNPVQSTSISFKGQPLKGAKRSMAINMAKSHAEVALVTLMEEADITHWEKREDLTVRLIQAIVAACKAEPALNVYYDHENTSVQTFNEVHLGIAVDTVDGLYVPVLKNAETLDSNKIRETVNRFKTKAKEKSFQAEELKGGTLILSNFGGIGGRFATPMVVPPMVSIVGVGRSHQELALVDGEVKMLKKLPISLSFDHRAVTGGEAARFLTIMIKHLQDQ